MSAALHTPHTPITLSETAFSHRSRQLGSAQASRQELPWIAYPLRLHIRILRHPCLKSIPARTKLHLLGRIRQELKHGFPAELSFTENRSKHPSAYPNFHGDATGCPIFPRRQTVELSFTENRSKDPPAYPKLPGDTMVFHGPQTRSPLKRTFVRENPSKDPLA